ncbi:LysR family transcriptional regulator [Cupriavidus sp. USMAHM13]|uniref:LysR family transcriptional regulator n=1 Tax=Cupriavidus sp. USMAHM13 TaxID=1389192 RepID=UPI0008A68EE0|nr:LysR family transcriptional regulator [Cupriavidus sp. USMAHM13]AOY98836.1 LysR family transcriptional regulator [Cupriavidus sp. USMAHM13]
MNLHDLEAFVAVVETGSIVGASARLHLTQPGITRRVQSLEERLGAVLLDRQAKPLRPTGAGRTAYEHGRRVLHAVEALRGGVSGEQDAAGEFRLGITPYLSEVALAAPLDRLHRTFPRLDLRVQSGWPEALAEQCRRHEIDAAAFCLPEGAPLPAGLEACDLGGQPVLVVAARELPLPADPSLADLAEQAWVLNPDGCGFRSAIRQRLAAAGLPLRVGIEAHANELRLSLVARGLGLGLTTAAALADSAWLPALRVVTVRDFQPRVRAWLVHRETPGRLAPPLRELRAALAEALDEAA